MKQPATCLSGLTVLWIRWFVESLRTLDTA